MKLTSFTVLSCSAGRTLTFVRMDFVYTHTTTLAWVTIALIHNWK